jgi:hypothetical protein
LGDASVLDDFAFLVGFESKEALVLIKKYLNGQVLFNGKLSRLAIGSNCLVDSAVCSTTDESYNSISIMDSNFACVTRRGHLSRIRRFCGKVLGLEILKEEKKRHSQRIGSLVPSKAAWTVPFWCGCGADAARAVAAADWLCILIFNTQEKQEYKGEFCNRIKCKRLRGGSNAGAKP